MEIQYHSIEEYFKNVPFIYQVDVAKFMGITPVQLNNYTTGRYIPDDEFIKKFNQAIVKAANKGRLRPMHIAKEMGAFIQDVSAWHTGKRNMPSKHKAAYKEAVSKLREQVSKNLAKIDK